MSTETATATRTILAMEGITKSFGGVQALKEVDFALRAGEVHAIAGQNGAGKSTLIKILAGALVADTGSIRVNATAVSFSSPADALRQGIGTVYQDPLVYPELSVTENIFMGRELRNRYGNIDRQAQKKRVHDLLRDLDVDPRLATQPIGLLSIAQRQLALIAKSLSWEPQVMIFDEPTAILTQHEVDNLFGIIRKLRSRDVGIIYISHRLEEIYSLADRVTVLKDGKNKGTWAVPSSTGRENATPSITTDQLIEVMAGKALLESVPHTGTRVPEPLLTVRGLTHQGMYRDVTFELHPGEIVGFFGLVGAGRSEVARALFGEEPAETGEIHVDGRSVRIRSPRQALSLGIAYLPEDRKGQGIFGSLSVAYNATITTIRQLATLGFVVQQRREEQIARNAVRDLSIKTSRIQLSVASLSGGNQQKVVLAKWLAVKPRVFILDEPTAGIDIASKQEIHNLIVELAREGVAIMLISSELAEVLKLSDRVITMHEGVVTDVFARGAAPNFVLAAAIGQEQEQEVLDSTITNSVNGTLHASLEEAELDDSTEAVEPKHAPLRMLPKEKAARPAAAKVKRGPIPLNTSSLRALLTRREIIILAFMVIGSILFDLTHPSFLAWNNIISMLSNASVVAIIAIGMTIVIVAGGIDVSIGSILALSMLAGARVIVVGIDNVLIVLLIALGVGLLVGIVNGSIVAFGRIHPIIVTLGTLNIIRALHIQLLGSQWITPAPILGPIAQGIFLGLPIPTWIACIIGLIMALFLKLRPLGRHIYALGGNAEAIRLAGVRVTRVRIFIYAVLGLLIGLAAIIQLGQSGTVQPNAGMSLELQVIAATVIGGTNILGGRGTIIGSLLGALLIEVMHNALITMGTLSLLEGLVVGILILIAVGLDVLQNRKAAKV